MYRYRVRDYWSAQDGILVTITEAEKFKKEIIDLIPNARDHFFLISNNLVFLKASGAP